MNQSKRRIMAVVRIMAAVHARAAIWRTFEPAILRRLIVAPFLVSVVSASVRAMSIMIPDSDASSASEFEASAGRAALGDLTPPSPSPPLLSANAPPGCAFACTDVGSARGAFDAVSCAVS